MSDLQKSFSESWADAEDDDEFMSGSHSIVGCSSSDNVKKPKRALRRVHVRETYGRRNPKPVASTNISCESVTKRRGGSFIVTDPGPEDPAKIAEDFRDVRAMLKKYPSGDFIVTRDSRGAVYIQYTRDASTEVPSEGDLLWLDPDLVPIEVNKK
jgi:hypothetical protein